MIFVKGERDWPRRERTRKAKKEKRKKTGYRRERRISYSVYNCTEPRFKHSGKNCDRGCGLPRRVFAAALHALFSSYFTQTREADQISSSDGTKWIPD